MRGATSIGIRVWVVVWFLSCQFPVCAQQTAPTSAPRQRGTDRAFFAALARRIEPDLKGDPSRLDQYIGFYRQELANDTRLFDFQVAAIRDTVKENSIRLTGHVEFSEHRTAVENMLRVLGFEIRANEIQLLPDESLGEFRFGLLNVPRSLSFGSPAGERVVGTECVLGEPLYLLKKSEQHYLCHCSDGYLGYVAERDVLPVNENRFASYLLGDRVLVQVDQTVDHHRLPAGARLKLIEQTDQGLQAELPDGTTILVSSPHGVVQSAATRQIESIISAGKSFLGAKYFWGGKSKEGIDCSGLVQVAYQAAGFHLPRDSNQQFILGSLSGTRWCTSTMRRGDAMYFLGPRGRIRHTAIYLGDGLYLHAAIPDVSVASLDPSHPAYDARRRRSFAFAKRLID